MGFKVIPSDRAYKDSHPPFYESEHWDYHFSLPPIFKPLPFLTVPHTYPRRDLVPNPKVLHSLLRLYQTLESIHFWKGREKLRRLRKGSGDEEERTQREEERIEK